MANGPWNPREINTIESLLEITPRYLKACSVYQFELRMRPLDGHAAYSIRDFIAIHEMTVYP